jgi:hypothetical protein
MNYEVMNDLTRNEFRNEYDLGMPRIERLSTSLVLLKTG